MGPSQLVLCWQGGRERKRGSAGLLGLLQTPLVAAVIVDNGSGMSSPWLVLLFWHFSRCIPFVVVGRSQLLGIMDDTDQNGSSLRALVFDSSSGIFRCGVAGFPRVYVVVKPKMLCIMACMAQKDSYAAGVAGILAGFARYPAPRAVFPLFFGSASRRILAILDEEVQASLVVDNSGMFMVGFARDDALHAVFPVVVRPQMLVIMAGMDPQERLVAPCRKLRIFRSCRTSRSLIFLS